MNSIKSVAIIGSALVLAGCKLNASVSDGGSLQSLSGTRDCSEGAVCQFEITDTTFTDSFTAVPKEGYVFSGWFEEVGYFCGGSTNPTCELSNTAFAGNEGVEALVASQQEFNLMPTFEFVGIDSDGDGIKDHIDEDDDNDGIFDEFDPYPLDPTLPGSSVACNEEDQELVFESINWSVQPGQTVIEIPADGVVASQFTTTSASSFSGWVTLVPTTGTGYASFDLWISSCPGGTPVAQEYNGCFSSGGEASVRWSQEPEPRLLTSCKLQTDTVYYLNYATTGCNASFCGAFRNTRYIN